MNKGQAVLRHLWKAYLVPRLPTLGQLATLVLVAALLLFPASVSQHQLPATWQNSDLMISHWPTALLIQRTFWQEHHLPLWNPYFAGGQPLIADPLSALFYPPTYLVLFLSLRNYYFVLIMGHLIFAGLGMFLLARHAVRLSRFPALVAAISFMATPRLISHLGAGHITLLQTVSWYPWLALACWATVRDPYCWSPLLGICIALALLAGHPQMAYYGLLMTAGLAGWLLVKRWRLEGPRAVLMSIAGLIAAGMIGLLLAAIHLLPLMEFTAHSTRQLSVDSMDAYPLHSFFRALIVQPPPTSAAWEGLISPGPAVLALALFAVTILWRKTWPLLLAIVLVAMLAMGYASPLYWLAVHTLPYLVQFRSPARIWFVALVMIALLAGMSSEALLRSTQHAAYRETMVSGFLVILLVALPLITSDYGYARIGDPRVTTQPSQLARTAAQLAGSGRIYGVQRNIPQLDAVELQAPFADGWNPLLIESYVSYMSHAGGYIVNGYQLTIPPGHLPSTQPNATLLGLMNVSVVVSQNLLTDHHLVRVEKVDGTFIYRNTANAGPAYLVKPGPDGNPPSLDQLQRLNDSVHTVSQTTDQEEFTFSTSTTAYCVIAIPAFPGWTAELDGHPVTVQQIAGVLPAIKVGPGTHTLHYTYAPSSLRLGALLSASGLLVVLAWLIIVWRLWKRVWQVFQGDHKLIR
ncbi:MAG TPA: YfhO family protein [Ktedonobacteraceae bacterium]